MAGNTINARHGARLIKNSRKTNIEIANSAA
jgi:hypothetical protein